jgi:hypothetical protein
MKIIALRQPFLWMVLHLGKTIENRSRPIFGAYRGPILLHASKAKSSRNEADYYYGACSWVGTEFGRDVVNRIPAMDRLPMGGIVGRARIVDVIWPYTTETVAIDIAKYNGVDDRWWIRYQTGYILADVEPLKFIPWSGCQGAQTAPHDLISKLEPA